MEQPTTDSTDKPNNVSVAQAITLTTTTSDASECIQLPNEILHLIVAECENFEYTARGRTLRACSRASWQLRAIVLPYLFSRIRVTAPIFKKTKPMSRYIEFMKATPWIARHVREVTVAATTVLIAELAALLDQLPCLEHVGLTPLDIVPSDVTISTEHPRSTSNLLIDISHLCELEAIDVFGLCAENFKLFAKVDVLRIRDGTIMGRTRPPIDGSHAQTMKDVAAAAGTLGENWELDGAVLGWGATPFLTTLLGSGALSHITFLNCTVLSSDLDPLGKILCNLGPSLSSLHLKAAIGPQAIGTNHTETLCRGLACTSLKSFSLVFDRPDITDDQLTLPAHCLILGSDLWTLATVLISALPAHQLNSLRLRITNYQANMNENMHSDPIPWPALRKALSRFTHIRSIEIQAEALLYALNGCIAYELRQFKGILEIKGPMRKSTLCKHVDCQQYAEETNEKLPSSQTGTD